MQILPDNPSLRQVTAHLSARGEVPLVLVRHGRTASNIERRFVGRMDVPLDEVGLDEAARLARRLRGLPRVALYSSPLSRARQTAAALGEAQHVDALMELDQGELEGMRFPDALPRYPAFFRAWGEDPTHVQVPGGESLGECQARGMGALISLAQAHGPAAPVVVVSHKMVICAAVLGALGVPLKAFRRVPMVNTAVNVFGWSEGSGLRVYRFNDSRHLR